MPAANAVAPTELTAAGPNRAMARPATKKAKMGTIAGPGATESPVFSADQPQTFCSHSANDSSIPPNATENTAAPKVAPENARQRNSLGGTSGFSARRQCATKAAIAASDTASTATVVGEPHPHSPPSTSPSVSAPTPPVTSSAPNASGRGPAWPGTAGSQRKPATSAARPTGT